MFLVGQAPPYDLLGQPSIANDIQKHWQQGQAGLFRRARALPSGSRDKTT
jgi:hypothetical protein